MSKPTWKGGQPRMKGKHTKASKKGGCGESVTFVIVLIVGLTLMMWL